MVYLIVRIGGGFRVVPVVSSLLIPGTPFCLLTGQAGWGRQCTGNGFPHRGERPPPPATGSQQKKSKSPWSAMQTPAVRQNLKTHLGDGTVWDLAWQQPAVPESVRGSVHGASVCAGEIRWSKWERERKPESEGRGRQTQRLGERQRDRGTRESGKVCPGPHWHRAL